MRSSNLVQNTIFLISCLFVLVIWSIPAMAQDSLLINYQGQLTDAEGEPLDASVAITFSIYADTIDPEYLWLERHSDVEVTAGLFSVLLGSVNALPDLVFNGENRYLGISVEGGDELSPRTLLTSSPGAAVSRRVVGDILTGPGMLLIKNSAEDSAIVLAAVGETHAIRIHPPDPCTPPDPCIPAFELIADAEIHSMKIFPPDPCVPPDPCLPAFEVVSDAMLEKVSMTLIPPPDDNTPSVELAVDAAEMASSIRLMPPLDDGKPGIELTVNAATSTGSFRIGQPPPDDGKPSVEITTTASSSVVMVQGEDPAGGSEPPLIVMSADAVAAKLGIGTDSLAEALTVMGNGWFSGDVFIYTLTRAKRNIVPIDGALEKVNRMNGYYYDCRTDEYPGLHMPEDRQIGFLAEEVSKVVPEAVGENEFGLTGVSYGRITALLVEAVKELKADNEELKARIETLEQK